MFDHLKIALSSIVFRRSYPPLRKQWALRYGLHPWRCISRIAWSCPLVHSQSNFAAKQSSFIMQLHLMKPAYLTAHNQLPQTMHISKEKQVGSGSSRQDVPNVRLPYDVTVQALRERYTKTLLMRNLKSWASQNMHEAARTDRSYGRAIPSFTGPFLTSLSSAHIYLPSIPNFTLSTSQSLSYAPSRTHPSPKIPICYANNASPPPSPVFASHLHHLSRTRQADHYRHWDEYDYKHTGDQTKWDDRKI